MISPHRLLLVLLACTPALTCAAGVEELAAGRKAFMRAYEQVDAATGAQSSDPEVLREHPLYPYLQAARLRRALANVDGASAAVDERVATFLALHDGEPVGRQLRRVWLDSLAQRAQWRAFLEQYRPDASDESLGCLELTARIETQQTQQLAETIAQRWLTPRSLPDCQRAFDWLKQQGGLTPALIEERARLALRENNPSFARQMIALLPPERAAALKLWAGLLEKPLREIDAVIAEPSLPVEPDALLAGWQRLARTDRDAALLRFDALMGARKLDATAASPYALALALALAWDRRPQAEQYFAKVAPEQLDDYALEWRARAALWRNDWKGASAAIAAMSDGQRKHARWRYWAGRAAEFHNDEPLARQLYESVLLDDNFYSLMAAARLDRTLTPHQETLVADQVQQRRIGAMPEFVRARELVLAELRPLADAEWRVGYEQLTPEARRQALHLAASWGWYEQAIAAAAQMRIFNDYELLYPRPYDAPVRSAAQLAELAPDLIYSVMRQESLYRRDAISSAGARGLLQMMPETARRTARAWNKPRPTPEDLFEPKIIVPLGAAHLRELIDRFGGQTIVALAGYNAGPRAAARWLPTEAIEPDVWIENIPYNETRNYVQRILWHNLVFAWLRTGEPQRTSAWLARVAPVSDAPVLGQR